MISSVVMSPGSTIEEYHQEYAGIDRSIECWCTEDEGEEGEPMAEEPGDTDGTMPEDEE
jgi:hypothetical protein